MAIVAGAEVRNDTFWLITDSLGKLALSDDLVINTIVELAPAEKELIVSSFEYVEGELPFNMIDEGRLVVEEEM